MIVKSFEEVYLVTIQSHLYTFRVLVKLITLNDKSPLKYYLIFKIFELEKKFSDEGIKRMPESVVLRKELRFMAQWMAIMLEELYEKYYKDKFIRKEIETFQQRLFFTVEKEYFELPINQYNFLSSPIKLQSSEDEDST